MAECYHLLISIDFPVIFLTLNIGGSLLVKVVSSYDRAFLSWSKIKNLAATGMIHSHRLSYGLQ